MPIKGPGKFEGETYLTKAAYNLGAYDSEIGDVGDFGWYALMVNWFTKGKGPFHGIITENNVGFVSGKWYKTADEANGDWQLIEDDYGAFIREENEENEENEN